MSYNEFYDNLAKKLGKSKEAVAASSLIKYYGVLLEYDKEPAGAKVCVDGFSDIHPIVEAKNIVRGKIDAVYKSLTSQNVYTVKKLIETERDTYLESLKNSEDSYDNPLVEGGIETEKMKYERTLRGLNDYINELENQ